MPPEPFPWDRRDFRKHERSGSDPRFGGGFGGGGPPRWRDQQHPNAPPPHPPPYHHHSHHHQQQQRWYSDFRPRLLPPVHGKQAGWHTYPDEDSHGFLHFGSRFSDRNLEEENFRAYGSCSDGGRYFRNGRENRGSFSQKEWKATSWEPVAVSSGPGRPNAEANDQRPIENTQTGHDSIGVNNSSKGKNPSHPPDSVNPLEKPQSLEKEQQDKNGGNADGSANMGKFEKENCLGSIDWKPLKWSRSGSLSSRGSSLSRTSSSKSMGVDSIETVAEVQQKKVTPVQSPTMEAAACVTTTAPASSEETSSRKKPRLGWGEGLAKYEKKKVDGPEDCVTKNGLVISVSNIEETVQFHTINLLDKSPRVAGLLDCASPATPSSVACSSSPGLEEKESIKAANVYHDAANLSCSPSVVSQTPYEGPTFNLENLELTSIASVSSLISELLQSDDLSSRDTNYLGANSMNKLLLWKGDVLKALEMTESEIDSLETELKSLISVPRSCFPHPDASSSHPREFCLKPCEEQVTASTFTFRPAPLQLVSSGDVIVENTPVAVEDEHARLKPENIDSPGSATSKYIEVSPPGEDVYPSQTAEGFVNLDVNNSSNLDEKYLDNGLSDEENTGCADYHGLTVTNSCRDLAEVSEMHYNIQDIYDSILASNKDSANGASEILNKLLPAKQCLFYFTKGSSVSCLQGDPSLIRKNFLMRKRFLRFKEKVLTIKYRLLQHFWMEGRLVSVRKLRAKSHKKLDLTGHKKHRYSRSRISALAGSSRTVPAEDVIEFVSRLLSESSFKPSRNTLKMPALILDKKKMQLSRFISNNGLVEDPCAVENERSMINSWTSEEREIFIDKLATFGKDFSKISSFLDHKTTADCIEFYYKNHKSDCFERARKKPDDMKQSKSQSTTYLVASGKRWNREAAAASLDILGEASAIAANVDDSIENQKCTSRFNFGASGAYKAPRCYDGPSQRSNSLDLYSNEREAVAADVLAGICGSLSSEAVSSCITSSVDPGDGYQDWRCQRVGFSAKRPLTPEVTQSVDDECSDKSCGEMDPTDWTDEEKSIFIQAVSSYGNDFVMISQCVRTRSRDQCKVFFSKARKCLGLDLIHPGLGNAVSGDVNGGGSDIEDANVVETGSVTSNEGSGCKTEEDLPSPDMKLSHASDVSGTQHLKPDSKRREEYNGLGSLDPMDAEPVIKNLLVDNPQLDGSRVLDVTGHNDVNGGTMVVSSVAESSRGVEEAADCGLPNGSSDAENMILVEGSEGHRGKEIEGPDLLLAEDKFDNKKVEDSDVNSTEVSGLNRTVSEMTSESQLAENASHPSVHTHSSEVDKVFGCQKKADLESSSAEKSRVVSLQQNGHIASLMSSTLFSVPIKYQNLPNHNALSAVGVNGVDDEHSQNIVRTGDCQQHITGHSLPDHVESSQILRGYPVSVPSINMEVNGCVSCKKPVPLQNGPRSDGNLHLNHHTELSLQKCNSSRNHSKAVETSRPLQEQTVDHSRPQSSCSSDLEKPSGNGDVKLFGKILISSQQKPNSCGQQTDYSNGQHHKSGCPSLNLKYSEQKVNLDSALSKFDCNNYLGSENIPVRNFGFWDGSRMQTVFPPIPDSSLLLTKYPAAFNNYARPAAKVDQPPSHGGVKSSDRSLNGVSVFPSRELCSSNGIADYLKNREVQPFTIDMKNSQDMFSDMQRRNGFDVVSGMQQQSRGIVGINVGRGGVLVGGQCSGVSDPVAAIKMHYAKTEQFSLQAGNIIKEDDTWRSKGM